MGKTRQTLFAVLLAFVAVAAFGQSGSDTVAVVNGTEIERDQFERLLRSNIAQYESQGRELSDEDVSSLAPVVLESLINQEVLYQQSAKEGIDVSESEIEEQVATIEAEYGGPDELNDALENQGVSRQELRTSIVQSIAVQKLLQNQLGDSIQVSDAEIERFYESNPDSFRRPEQVRVRHILISTERLTTEEEKQDARRRIEGILQQVLDGADFARMAREHSEGPSREAGGDLGYFERGEMVAPFEEAAFGTPIGQVSGIVETRFGYHILKVLDHREPTIVDLTDDVKNNVRDFLLQQKSRQVVASYVETLKAEADITRNR